jgi:cytochrome P450 family 142 subfamily A polypeptide 1
MADIDIAYLDSANWNERDMLARMKWLRENDPVHWSERDQCWLVTKFADVEYCSKHQELFTSAFGVRPGSPMKIGLIDEEEPRHSQLRALINRGFTPRMVARLEEIFRALTVEHVDAVAEAGECDFVQAVSVPLPLKLIAAMIGIRREDYDRFHRWSDAMISAEGRMSDPEVMARAGAAFMEYATYVNAVIEDRRRQPQDDLVSVLTGAKDRGLLREFDEQRAFEHMTDPNMQLANDELIKLMVILLVAGNETTRNGISGGMQLLIENPGERRKLARDPSLIRGAVEEMVRLASPVRSFGRTVVRDTELRGRALREGQSLLMLYPSANRDEEVFEAADEFRVDRNPHHLGFGVGSHFCLGANLARMEMRVVFEEILRRLPDMEYAAGGPVLHPSSLVRSCVEMRVRYTPERRAAA